MTLPNFIIAGAPKCGTTALYEYLQTHPQVFLTEPKEPHFHAEDLGDHRQVPTREQYLKLFDGVRPGQTAIGEASVWSMHSSHALERIKAELPGIRLVVMLRSPIEFVRSLHSDLVWICFEDEPDFERAWALSAQRRAGRRVPRLCQVPWFLDYERVGRLGERVQRMLRVFPREQVKIMLLDDLRDSPQRVYEETLAFLGLPSDGRRDFQRFNAGKQNRSQWLATARAAVIRSLPRPVIEFGKRLGMGRASEAIMHINSRPAKVTPLRADFRRQLADAFRDDVQLLGESIGRDLSHWISSSATPA
jgi:hypothetical protein